MAEHQVGSAQNLLKNNEMIRLELEGKSVVLGRVGETYYAFGGKCSHYGAPLEKGMLKGHTVMCPWHHACFDIRSGARLEPPALNDIACYPVRIDGEQVVISLPHTNSREPEGKRDGIDTRSFVVVGGGAAGNAAVEELRRAGFRGRIVLVSASSTVPVDRPNLSKNFLAGDAKPDWIPLRGQDWYANRDIEIRLNARVVQVLSDTHQLCLSDGELLPYDRLLLCTGGVPRYFSGVPGADLGGIFTLRSFDDAQRIIEAASVGKRAVVVGASFIGLEVSAALARGREVDITVVAHDSVPFSRILGEDIGRMLQREHENHGIHFRLRDGVRAFHGTGDQVSSVELNSGELIPADFVVAGIGVRPATDFLATSSIRRDPEDGSVLVDSNLQTNVPDVFAAGDIARWSSEGEAGQRIEHWRVAQQHGIVAARNMLGDQLDVRGRVPFFWTNQWDVALRYVGNASDWDEVIYRGGTPDEKSFVAFYMHEGRLKAAVGCKHDREMDAVEFVLRDHLPLHPDQLRDDDFDLVAYASSGYVSSET